MPRFTEYTISGYIQSKCTLAERIAAIDLLIMNTITLLGETISGAGGNIASYELDDQQVHIKTTYRSIADVQAGLHALETMKQTYMNQYNGRVFTMQDRGTFKG